MRKRRGRDRRETRIATSPRGRGKRKENEGFREAWGWMMAGEAVGRGRAERESFLALRVTLRMAAPDWGRREEEKSMSLSHSIGKKETVNE